jgi:hypothetical protein
MTTMGTDGSTNDPARELAELAEEIDEVERHAARTVELGRRGFVLAALVFVLVISLLLPWVGDLAGWQVLAGDGGAVPRLFAATIVGFGILASSVVLITRRWWLTWVCAIGGWFTCVDGMLAIWSQQSSGVSGYAGDGPGIGMVIALAAAIVMLILWMRTAWSRQ